MASRGATGNRETISAQLSAQAKRDLDALCAARGMTIKALTGRLVQWFLSLDRSEQAIVLAQVEQADTHSLSQIVLKRRAARPRRP